MRAPKTVVVALGALLAGGCVEAHPGWAGPSTSGTTSAGTASSGSVSTGSVSTVGSTGDASDAGTTGGGGSSATGGMATTGSTGGAGGTGGTGGTGAAPPRQIFVSSTTRYGAFGDPTVADGVCQAAADTANLGRTWKALLSTSTLDAAARLDLQGELINMVGEVVAIDGPDLWDGSLAASVGFDESGAVAATSVWSGSEPDGTVSALTCEDWTAPTGSVDGNAGNSAMTDGPWMSATPVACAQSAHFYCVSD